MQSIHLHNRARMYRHLATVSAFVCAGFLLLAHSTHAATPDTYTCHTIHAGNSTQPMHRSFGSPYNLYQNSGTLLMQVHCTEQGGVKAILGDGNPELLIYEYGFELIRGKYRRVRFTNVTDGRGWLTGTAEAILRPTESGTGSVFAYMCKLIDGAWKCGCQDHACTHAFWQRQDYDMTHRVKAQEQWVADGDVTAHEIVVYNTHSMQPQRMIRNTRFMSPTGEVYRIKKELIVPGYTFGPSGIVPGHVRTIVYPDSTPLTGTPHSDVLWTVPGFSGLPHEGKIYARSYDVATYTAEVAQMAEDQVRSTLPSSSVKTSVTLLSPNGGEQYYAGSEQKMKIRMRIGGVYDGVRVCTSLERQSDGKLFAFPGSGSCSSAVNGEVVRTGTLLRNPGFDLGPGTYRLYVRVYEPYRTDGKDSAEIASDTSDGLITLLGPDGTSLSSNDAMVQAPIDTAFTTTNNGVTASVSILSPAPNDTVTIGYPIPVRWRVHGAPGQTQVRVHVSAITTTGGGSGISGGTRSEPVVRNGEGYYRYTTGPGHLTLPGMYTVHVDLASCHSPGCTYHPLNYQPTVYAQSKSVRVLVVE